MLPNTFDTEVLEAPSPSAKFTMSALSGAHGRFRGTEQLLGLFDALANGSCSV
jgi:hypothetical protein